jgi:hypothetical protein
MSVLTAQCNIRGQFERQRGAHPPGRTRLVHMRQLGNAYLALNGIVLTNQQNALCARGVGILGEGCARSREDGRFFSQPCEDARDVLYS